MTRHGELGERQGNVCMRTCSHSSMSMLASPNVPVCPATTMVWFVSVYDRLRERNALIPSWLAWLRVEKADLNRASRLRGSDGALRSTDGTVTCRAQ
jgi:hypothetical protein